MEIDKSNGPEAEFEQQRHRMVARQLAARQIVDTTVLDAMRTVPRHEFVPSGMRDKAYDDSPLSIGHDQTISQPYIVGLMTEAVEPKPTDRILEIGSGCGYQTAVLAEIVEKVYSIELVPELHQMARENLERLAYRNVELRQGDGSRGWPEAAPFDGVVITAASPKMPSAVIDQLKVGGCMIVPLGSGYAGSQELLRLRKTEDGLMRESLGDVRFVPMRGEIEKD